MAEGQRTLRVVIVGNAASAQRALRAVAGDAGTLERRSRTLGGGFAALGTRLAAFGRTAALGLGVATGAAAVWGIKTAANMEQAQIAFTTMLGSAKKATDFLAKLEQFAIKTPFSTEDVIQYSQSLLAMGFDAKDILPTLTDVGDAVSGLGGGSEKLQRVLIAMGQIKAKGKVMATEMLQLTENGIPAWQMLADSMHKTIPEVMKLSEKGALKADDAIAALQEGMRKRFGGMMKNQATTVAGMWSTLKDTTQVALGNIMKAFFPLIKTVLPMVTKGASKLAQVLPPIFQRAGAAIGPFVSTLRDLFGSKVMPVLRAVGDYVNGTLVPMMRDNFQRIQPVVMSLADVIRKNILPAFKTIGAGLLPVVTTIVSVFETKIIPAVVGFIAAIMPSINRFAGFIKGTVAPLLVWAFQQAQPVLVKFGNVFTTVFQAIAAIINVLTPVIAFLWKYLLGPVVISTLKGLWSGIIGVISGALSIIQGIANIFLGIFTGNWSKAWTGIKQIFSGIWQVIVGAFKIWIFGKIFGIMRGGIVRIASLWRAGWTGIRSVFTGIIGFIRGGVSGWVSGIEGILARGVSFFRSVWSLGWNGIKTTVQVNGRFILSAVRTIPARILGFFRGLPGKLLQIGKDIVAGLVNGIKSQAGAVLGAAKSLVDNIPGPIKKLMGIHSPSRVMADIGTWITRGLVVGMLAGSKSVLKTSNKLHDLVTKAFRAGGIKRSRADDLHAYISKENKKLMKLAKDREKVAAQLKTAQKKLDDLKKSRSAMASSVAEKARDFGSFVNSFSTDEGADNSPSSILARMRQKLQTIIKFRQNLATLHKRGFSNGIINEIAQAGPEQGSAMAAALMNASSADMKAINSTYSQINKQSTALGQKVAADYYKAGIDSAQGLVNGLKKKESEITKAIKKIAQGMVKTLRKELGIKSPSRVFRGEGVWVGKGMALGVDDSQKDVQAAVNRLAGTRPTNSLANRTAAAYGPSTGHHGITPPQITVNVSGHVTTEQNLAKAIAATVRDEIVRTGKRNGGRTGL